MASVASIGEMKARTLVVMSTRSEDQDLVSKVASEQGISNAEDLPQNGSSQSLKVIPSFGWHPWFSYQLYDDLAPEPTCDGTREGKIAHYDKILAPSPSSKDPEFCTGLPDPRPLSAFIAETRSRLETHPHALVGEIGLDKAFRLPHTWMSDDAPERDEGLTPGGREGRRLSPHRVVVDHQTAILKAQLRLAGEMNRAVSVHGVQIHGGLYSTIAECWKGHELEVLSRRQQRRVAEHAEDFSDESDEEDGGMAESARITPKRPSVKNAGPKAFPPRICLHSYSGPVTFLKQYVEPSVPAKVFFSFSTAVNWGARGSERTEEAVRAVPDDRILAESDLDSAGEEMDEALEDVCRKICELKGWKLREGVEKLAENWREFVFDKRAP